MGNIGRAAGGRTRTQPELAGAAISPRCASSPGASGYARIKVGIEWIAALALLILAAPVAVVLTVLLTCTSKGPVVYSQMRLGQFGRPFRMYKFRTMTHGCEAVTGPVWSIGDDPRVTKVGQWLRDTHLDELPQLWNVLSGDMSLIGPRPERPEIAAEIERSLPEFRDRLRVRPGITGLAQMRLPSDSDIHTVRRKLAHDLHYVLKMGPALDVRIALSTVLHFMGAAITAASRQLVRPFAPPLPAEAPAVLPRLSLTAADTGSGSLLAVAGRDELSKAA